MAGTALCPSFHRGCYGCFGPMESPNVPALRAQLAEVGLDGAAIDRLLHTFNTAAFAAAEQDVAARAAEGVSA